MAAMNQLMRDGTHVREGETSCGHYCLEAASGSGMQASPFFDGVCGGIPINLADDQVWVKDPSTCSGRSAASSKKARIICKLRQKGSCGVMVLLSGTAWKAIWSRLCRRLSEMLGQSCLCRVCCSWGQIIQQLAQRPKRSSSCCMTSTEPLPGCDAAMLLHALEKTVSCSTAASAGES